MPDPSSTAAAGNQRRTLRFNTVEEAIAEVDRLAAAEKQGTLRAVGQWTFGQNLGHLAAWVDYGFTGAPVKVPFYIRWAARPFKRVILSRTLPAGRNLPGVAGGTLGRDVISSEVGVARFRALFERIAREMPAEPHVFLGRLTHAEWIAINLRHAELHLGFLRTD